MKFEKELKGLKKSDSEALKEFIDLIKNIRELKKEDGCPWHRAQSHESLLPFLKEESYEFINAVKSKNKLNMVEELGDILLQVMLHSEIAQEASEFLLKDIIENLNHKVINRHPYLFEQKVKVDIEEAKAIWKERKENEKIQSKKFNKKNFIDNDFKTLPADIITKKIIRETENSNFYWKNHNHIISKLNEEIDELKEALISKNLKNIKEEFGDLYFTLINLSYFLNLDHDDCLRKANNKFLKRFLFIKEYTDDKINIQSQEKLLEIWQIAKERLKNKE